jgi:hypothetical protein
MYDQNNQNQGFNQFNPQPALNQNPYQTTTYIPVNQGSQNPYQTTTYIPPGQYMNSSPMTMQTQAVPIGNQPRPSEVRAIQSSLKSGSVYVNCPHCGNQGTTKTIQSCSCASIICCSVVLTVPWVIWQACRGKEINCYNAKHFCMKCGLEIGEYKSC